MGLLPIIYSVVISPRLNMYNINKLRSIILAFGLWLMLVVPVWAMEPIVVGGSGADLETFRILAGEFSKQNPTYNIKVIPSIGSSGAVRGVATGRVDLGLMSRPLKGKERERGLTVIHYADTALVYVVAKGHHVKQVDTDTLKEIYTGGSNTHGLRPVLRPKLDSDTLVLEEKLPGIRDALAQAYSRKGVPIGTSDQASINILLKSEDVITTSTLSLVMSEKPAVQVLSLDGVSPNASTLSNGTYPLIKKLFMLHDGKLTGFKSRFIDFILSDKGADILARTGHVPMKP